MMKHIAIPQALINTRNSLAALKDVERSEEDQAAYESAIAENNLALSKVGDIEMTADEEAAFIAEQKEAQASSEASVLKTQALAALSRTDSVAMRCFKSGVPFPPDWLAYITELRAIVSTGNGIIPQQPQYPVGT